MRIASNINNILLVSTNTCIFKYNSYSHYILGQQKVCSCRQAEQQVATGNSAARDLFVHTRAVA